MITIESVPNWLKSWAPGRPISAMDFLASRLVFYPGSGTDGQPVAVFGSRHAAHCFVFVDYGLAKDHILSELADTGHPFAGYSSAGRQVLHMSDLRSRGWRPHFRPESAPRPPIDLCRPYAFIEILERRMGLDDTHGPKRLAILFLCADGVATYDVLFCQPTGRAPFVLVLQDHGFGGNWTRFGRGGYLERIALQTGRFPEFLLVAQNTKAWNGYSAIEGAVFGGGGQHGFNRQIWRRS